ncbi:MAG: hypothetical protein FWC47_02825 [Oscillospiraceae bacterium]|nr:hypothetical protein [Oscillospiraceae bacterium]
MDFSKEFKNWLLEKISDALDDYEGAIVYSCDLALKLFEGENANGSVSCSSYEAKEFIRQYWDDAGEIFDDWKSNIGESLNPFENPESFQVIMLLEGARDVLSQSSFLDDHWNDEFELTRDVIKTIKTDIGIDCTPSLDSEGREAREVSLDMATYALDAYIPEQAQKVM